MRSGKYLSRQDSFGYIQNLFCIFAREDSPSMTIFFKITQI